MHFTVQYPSILKVKFLFEVTANPTLYIYCFFVFVNYRMQCNIWYQEVIRTDLSLYYYFCPNITFFPLLSHNLLAVHSNPPQAPIKTASYCFYKSLDKLTNFCSLLQSRYTFQIYSQSVPPPSFDAIYNLQYRLITYGKISHPDR